MSSFPLAEVLLVMGDVNVVEHSLAELAIRLTEQRRTTFKDSVRFERVDVVLPDDSVGLLVLLVGNR